MDYFGPKYHYVEQREQLGTGHAVMQCAESFRDYDGTVLIAFGDMILFRGAVMEAQCRHHEETHASCTLMTAVNPALTMWARILRDSQGRFVRVVEGKDCTPEQAKIPELEAGVLVFDSKKLFRMLPSLRDNNIQHEYYLTDIPQMMAAQGMLVETYATDDPEDVFGINSPEDVSRCERIVRAREARDEIRAK